MNTPRLGVATSVDAPGAGGIRGILGGTGGALQKRELAWPWSSSSCSPPSCRPTFSNLGTCSTSRGKFHHWDRCRRHDLRHPDRRHRPLGRFDLGTGRRCRRPAAAEWCRGAAGGGARSPAWDRARPRKRAGDHHRGIPLHHDPGHARDGPWRGLTYAEGQPVSLGDAKERFSWLGRGDIAGIPVPVFIFAFVAIVGIIVLRFTTFGRYIYAIGSNREAARLAGVKVRAYTTLVYVISGFLAALTALIWISRLTVGEPTAGTGIELDAIAVVVIGGTSLFGGEGGIGGTVIGAMIVGVLANVLNLLGVSPFTQQIVTGALIVLAVLLGRIRR